MLRKFFKHGIYGTMVIWGGLILFSYVPAFSQGIIMTDNPLEGRKIFETKGCIKCHAVHEIGGDIGPDLGKDPNIRGIIEITAAMWNHSPGMTEEMRKQYYSRPTFTMQEIEKLYTFLYYLRYLQTEGNAERGKRIFREKECIKCHSIGTTQPGTGPDLLNFTYFVSPLYLIQAIWNHGREMEDMMGEMEISRPELAENDLQDIASYLRTINTTPKRQLQYIAPGNPSNGERIFIENKCALCHELKDRTVSIGPDLRKADYNQSASYIGAVLWNHTPQMWQMMRDNDIDIPQLQNEDVADIIAFIYFLKFSQIKGNAQDGKTTFTDKGCITCHRIDEEGGDVGPPISEMPDVSSALEFSRVIWNHASIMEQNMDEYNLPWPEFSTTEMEDLFAFLRAITLK